MECFECAGPAVMDHHVIPRSLGGVRTVPLCEICHGKIHSIDFTDHSQLIKQGLEKARKRGATLGRPRTYTDAQLEQAVVMVDTGVSIRATAKHFGVSATTLRTYIKSL